MSLEYLSVAWMSVEVIGTLLVGVLSLSFALMAFGGDSVVELLSAAVVLGHLRKDTAGSNHLGGRAAFVSTLLLFLLIPVIVVPSTYFFFVARTSPTFSPTGLVIAAIAVAVMPLLWLRKRSIARDTNCLPLSVDATESATCFMMAAAVFAGLLAEAAFRIVWADYVTTLVIIGFVASEAYSSLREYVSLRGTFIAQP